MTAADILAEAAKTYLERNKVYGDNFLRVGGALQAFSPDGITLKTKDDHNRFHLFVLAIVKMSRYAVNWEKGHQDSIHDAVVYGAMLEALDSETVDLRTL